MERLPIHGEWGLKSSVVVECDFKIGYRKQKFGENQVCLI